MNIYRHSQAGRNFEYLGEDPHLAAAMIGEYVTGLQSTGVMATLKHFAANNSDFFRRKSNSVLDDRTLREIYLPAFQAGIDAGARAVMTGYNLVNGEWASQNRWLITEVLRNEMGFDGLVMTDWWAVSNAEKLILSGQDLEMPAPQILEDALSLINAGSVSEADIDRMLISQIAAALSLDLYREDFKMPELASRFPEHAGIALETARQGTVLLKNDDLLPLAPETKILLTGKFIRQRAFGGGAAEVEGYDWLTMEEALAKSFPSLRCAEDPTPDDIAWADALIVSTGTLDHEGWDRPFALPSDEEQFVRRMVASDKPAAVIVNAGGGIRMTGWNDQAAAVVYGWYGGQAGNGALAEILSGAVNPSGKLPITIEREFTDSPGAGYLPDGEQLYSGWNGEGEKAHEVFDVIYDEGMFVGYRWYDAKNIEPLYPFGHGLSYTSFDYSDLEIVGSPEGLSIAFAVSNAGDRAGAEVAQVYVGAPGARQPRPIRELKGSTRVVLAPGETKRIALSIGGRALSYWNPDSGSWEREAGVHRIAVGASSRDIRLEGSADLPG
jgi:beta-glucosidase